MTVQTNEAAREAAKSEAFEVVAEIAGKLTGEKITRLAAYERACRIDVMPAADAACSNCPWRRDNAGAEDPLLSEEALVGHWDRIRDGNPFACHKTSIDADALSADDQSRGWCEVPEGVSTRECAGALAQMLKEEGLRDELGSFEAYFALRGPHGVSRQGFAVLARRRRGQARLPVREVSKLAQYGREWFPNPVGANSLPVVPPCFCPVCEHHEDVHGQAGATPPGSGAPVMIDVALIPLVEALWAAGAVTFASCENLRDAVEQLWPDSLDRLSGAHSYANLMRTGHAYIQGVDGAVWDGVADEAKRLGGRVIRMAPAIHLEFPPERVPELVRACGRA